MPFLSQGPGEFGAVAAGAFHPGGDDRAETGDEVDDLPVAGPHGQELLVGEVPPVSVMTATWWVSAWVSIPAMTFGCSFAMMKLP